MERRVVVTGIGVISALGDSPGALHTALCAGRSSLQPITLFNTDGLVCKQAHALASFTPENLPGQEKSSRPGSYLATRNCCGDIGAGPELLVDRDASPA